MAINSTKTPGEGLDLRRLSQAQAALLIGKPAVWLRDNAHLASDSRNDDGSYDGPRLVAVLSRSTAYAVAELPNGDVEKARQLSESLGYELYTARPALIRWLEEVDRTFGAPGLAAIGRMMLEFLKHQMDSPAEQAACVVPTAEQVRKKHAEAAEREIEQAREQVASRNLRCVYVCDSCGNYYRYGRSWLPVPIPEGFAAWDGTDDCPQCRQKAIDTKKRRGKQSANSLAKELKEFDNL